MRAPGLLCCLAAQACRRRPPTPARPPACSTPSAPAAAAPPPCSRFHWQPRFQIVLACFLATLCAYVERVGFSIAYTAMAKDAGLGEAEEGTVLSAFYWGYGVSQIPGGWAAQAFGGAPMLSLSFLAWSLASMLTPGSATSTRALVTARVCVGLAQGFLIPAVHTVLAAWVPPTERARAVSLTTSGMYLGSALAMQVGARGGRAGVGRCRVCRVGVALACAVVSTILTTGGRGCRACVWPWRVQG